MKILILSDLHLEINREKSMFRYWPENTTQDFDVVVLAGDIAIKTDGLRWARKSFPSKEIIYVCGNHEFYGNDYEETLRACQESSKELSIHLLNNQSITIDDIKFLGTTLWTDFTFYDRPERDMKIAQRYISDFKIIYNKNTTFSPEDAVKLYSEAFQFLLNSLRKKQEKTIVVTHFPAGEQSVAPIFMGDNCNPYFVTETIHKLTLNKVSLPELWIHGHTHSSFDYDYKNTTTRVVCNPFGYSRENFNNFNPNKIVEI